MMSQAAGGMETRPIGKARTGCSRLPGSIWSWRNGAAGAGPCCSMENRCLRASSRVYSWLAHCCSRAIAVRPKGAATWQPRATPWVPEHNRSEALKGRNSLGFDSPRSSLVDVWTSCPTHGTDCFAPAGLCRTAHHRPRALPWAYMSRPCRAKCDHTYGEIRG